MFMRFLQLKIKSKEVQGLSKLYEAKIVPALQSAKGCLGTFLLQSTHHHDEVLSLSLWRSMEDSSAYERSGLFMRLVASARPFFADSTEWKLELSKDITLEHVPGSPEPAVQTYSVSAASGGEMLSGNHHPSTFMRIVSLRHKDGMLAEYKNLYRAEIIPTLLATRGCRYACLSIPTANESESISVTVWNSREDAETYERQGTFGKLLEKIKHTVSDLSRMQLESVGTLLPSATSEDVEVEGFQLIAGRNFQNERS